MLRRNIAKYSELLIVFNEIQSVYFILIMERKGKAVGKAH